MEYKYIKIDLNKFKIEYNGTQFKDINEYVIDLRNIFTQMFEIYNQFRKNTITDKTKLEELKLSINKQLGSLQEELQKRLNYITNSNNVSKTLVGKVRGKLMQLKSLNATMDIVKNPEHYISRLSNFYNKRVLEENLIVTQKIYSNR